MSWLAEEVYSKIHEVMPIFCVDLAIRRNDSIVLLKRKLEPDAGKWWLPGGRLRKGEAIMEAIGRVAREECGLMVEILAPMGHTDCWFNADPFGHGKGTHTVSLVWLCKPIGGELRPDENHDRAIWYSRYLHDKAIDDGMPSTVQTLVTRALEADLR